MPQVIPLTDAELAAVRRLHGPPRAALERVAHAARQLLETINRGEKMTGRPSAADVGRLQRALAELEPPAPPLPPPWRPDP